MAVEPLILAVDDEAGILRLIKLELSNQGFRVIVAGDGEALELAALLVRDNNIEAASARRSGA